MRTVLLSTPEVGSSKRFDRGSILFAQKQHASCLFLVESGLVKLTRASAFGRKLVLSVSGSHQLVGEESLAHGFSEHSSEASCLTRVIAYEIPLIAIKRLFAVPEFALSLLSYVLERDRQRVNRIELLALCDVEQRVLYSLAELAELINPNADGAFPIPMTQLEIASFVGATRETTSATLSDLQTRQLVRLERRLITTVHPDTLIDAANERLSRPAGSTS